MTGIICAKFQDELFMFADGRVTDGSFVLTDKDDKITKAGDTDIMTMCGDSSVMDQLMYLFYTSEVNTVTIKDMTGEGTWIWLNTQNITIVDIENDGTKDMPNHNGISTFKHQTLPMFFGSGRSSLSGAYFSLECPKAATREEYIKKVRQCYKGTCKYESSVGQLQQIESIRLLSNKQDKK